MFGYNNNGYMNTYMPPIQQRPMQMPNSQVAPFNDVRFVNEKEADGYILLPNQKALLIDTANKKFWIKWTDSLGASNTETYEFKRVDNSELALTEPKQIDTSNFAMKDDLKNVATKDELNNLKEIIEKLEKRVKISQILTENDTVGNI